MTDQQMREFVINQRVIEVYADGGCINSNPSQIGGTWAWCMVGEDGYVVAYSSGVVRGYATNNQMEMVALCKALRYLPKGWSGLVCSDSEVTLGRLFRGHAMNNIPVEWIPRVREIVSNLGEVQIRLLQGHPTKADLIAGIGKRKGLPVSKYNVYCDELCAKAGKEYLIKLKKEAINV